MTSTRTRAPKHHEAVINPSKRFRHPEQLVHTEALPQQVKHKALEEWEADERALQRASDEGMAGGEAPRLHEVKKAQQTLRERKK